MCWYPIKGSDFVSIYWSGGAEYVHAHMKPNEFIRELVELVGKHGCTMQRGERPFPLKGKAGSDGADG